MPIDPGKIKEAEQLLERRKAIGMQLLALADGITVTLGKGGNTHVVHLREGLLEGIQRTMENYLRTQTNDIERQLKALEVAVDETTWGPAGTRQRPGEPPQTGGPQNG